MVAIASFLTALPNNWKAVSALAGSFAAGLSFAGILLGSQVARNTDNIDAVTATVDTVRVEQRAANAKLDRAICLIELSLDGANPDPVQVGRMCP